ncbi:tripartite tricarboxylate transporter TctB family protein [Marinomonas balearica]|uniref:Putative tricarboxylic transport membrane protein n=1 Tax=Marinomonas balearica TaxID=491947 RepID=A0A4R6MI05_9GAMM|nr:tripartite tricarboxylate transporter TctB family protein [Marinomonas balearica]TDP01207.1 putative tricarboxylic transport membrane protein [Marinomonas balearica]
MILKERLLGVGGALFGALLLLYLIPTFVTGEVTESGDPSFFPRIAGWLFLVLGGLQILFATPSEETLPSKQEMGRLVLFVGAMVLGTSLLPIVGFLPYSMGLMAVIVLMVFEKRPHWIALTIVGVPIGTWLLFEQILQRPLP